MYDTKVPRYEINQIICENIYLPHRSKIDEMLFFLVVFLWNLTITKDLSNLVKMAISIKCTTELSKHSLKDYY